MAESPGFTGLRAPSLPGFPVSPLPGQCIISQPWLRALTHRVAPLMRGRPGCRRRRARVKRNVTRIAILSFLQIFTMFSSSMKQSGKRALQTCIRPIATSAYFDMLKDDEGNKYMEVSVNGVAALRLPQINKGAAFTMEERKALHFSGVSVSVFYGCVDLKRWC